MRSSDAASLSSRSLEPLVLARELAGEANPSTIGAAVRGILHVTAPLFQLEALDLAPEVRAELQDTLLCSAII